MKQRIRFSDRCIYALLCLFAIALMMNTKNFASAVNTKDDTETNLALIATVSTSHVSPWETLSAVNSGYDPASSSDNSQGAYGNWDGDASFNVYAWVQYEWEQAHQLNSTSIYWWDDGGGIRQPTDAYIEYWDVDSWVHAGNIDTELNQYNTLDLDIWTSRIRISMKSEMATGILQWKVLGIESEPCDPTPLTPFVAINQGNSEEGNIAGVLTGDAVHFDLLPETEEYWRWSGPLGFTADTRQVSLEDLDPEQSGTYTVNYLNECGVTSTQNFHLTVRGTDDGTPYMWPDYNPTLAYNFRDEYPDIEMPTENLDDDPNVVGSQSDRWWTFRWGPDKNPLVTESAITPMLERMNEDFEYYREVMGWPPDKRARRGYRSAIYLYGSGLNTDNASNTDLGGWQSAIHFQGESWPMVLLSYYPVYSFDPDCPYSDREFQMGAVVHEGIHSILADMPGVKQAAWFHEGGNTWLQQEADAERAGDFSSMGFLNSPALLAPFMPIETYSGWLQDGSFGGPSAEGVNMFEGGQQICTWRNLLGGTQYGNIFPTFLGMTLGVESVAWIWRYAPGRVLEGMADGLGEVQMRRLISEYRAKQALLDMGKWTGAMKGLLDSNFGIRIEAEWEPSWLNPEPWYATPYAKTTNDGNGLLTPEYRTTPGWSGANQIPLHVEGDIVKLDFQPLGTNMTLQICYRDEDGQPVYSEIVHGGECSIRLDTPPVNGVVFAVVTNTDYIYKGEETRKAHYDYRIQLLEGVKQTASVDLQWYDWTRNIIDPTLDVKETPGNEILETIIYPNPVSRSQMLKLELNYYRDNPVTVRITNMQGQVVFSDTFAGSSLQLNTADIMRAGMYVVTVSAEGHQRSYMLVVN